MPLRSHLSVLVLALRPYLRSDHFSGGGSIREILIISSPEHLGNYQRLLGTGEQFGLTFSYAVQPRPEGLAQAFIIGRDFVGADDVALVLGDNLFFGNGMSDLLARARARTSGATVFAYHVDHPEAYGVVTLDESGRPLRLAEKPKTPESPWAVTGGSSPAFYT